MKLISPLLSAAVSLLAFCSLPNHLYATKKSAEVLTEATLNSVSNIQLNWKQTDFPDGWFSYDPYKKPTLSGPESVTLHQGDTLSVSIENPRNDIYFGSFGSQELDMASNTITRTWKSWYENQSDILEDLTSNYINKLRFPRVEKRSFYPFLNDQSPLNFYFLANACGEVTITFYVLKAECTQNHSFRVRSNSEQEVSFWTLTVNVVE